jgi:prepilin-type N-terminal cleavage/methylation domain-containing protein
MTRKAFSLIEISIAIIIIGILIGGITQAIEMFSEASLKGARNLSKSSRITRIDDLSLWLDATSDKAFDTEKDDKSTISMWKDTNPRSTYPIVGNPVSANLPTYILSAINGLPTASFKKTSSNCMTIPSQSIVNNSEDFTLYLIFSPTSLDDGIILEKNNATATAFPFSLELNGGYYKFSIKDSTTTLSVLGAKKANINKPNLIRLSRTKGSQIEITINGVSSNKSDTLTSSTLNTAELAIGCRNGASPASFVNGNIGEIAFFDRNLTTKEKGDTEEYFYKKWKMKKYEGALAGSELPCSVPSSANTDLSITTVQSTSTPLTISCKAGYSGTPKYTCINGTFNIASGSCNLNCNVPLSANTDLSITTVQSTSAPQSINCKSGYSGTPKYTCINGTFAFDIAFGSCSPQITSCNVPEQCVYENFIGNYAVTDICFDLRGLIGATTVAVNSEGSYETSSNGYYQNGLNGRQYGLRWKCKSDGTISINIENGCMFSSSSTNRHIHYRRPTSNESYFTGFYDYETRSCCNGNYNTVNVNNFSSGNGNVSACPWPAW